MFFMVFGQTESEREREYKKETVKFTTFGAASVDRNRSKKLMFVAVRKVLRMKEGSRAKGSSFEYVPRCLVVQRNRRNKKKRRLVCEEGKGRD